MVCWFWAQATFLPLKQLVVQSNPRTKQITTFPRLSPILWYIVDFSKLFQIQDLCLELLRSWVHCPRIVFVRIVQIKSIRKKNPHSRNNRLNFTNSNQGFMRTICNAENDLQKINNEIINCERKCNKLDLHIKVAYFC